LLLCRVLVLQVVAAACCLTQTKLQPLSAI
jgi:hypothetical protein